MAVICKMRCSGVNTKEGYYQKNKIISREVILSVVWSDDPKSDCKKFADATPNGELKLTIDNPEASKQFTPGKEYYITIEEVKQ